MSNIQRLVERLERKGYKRSELSTKRLLSNCSIVISLSDKEYLLCVSEIGGAAIVHTRLRNIFSLSIEGSMIAILYEDGLLRLSFSTHGHYRDGSDLLGTGYNGMESGIQYYIPPIASDNY